MVGESTRPWNGLIYRDLPARGPASHGGGVRLTREGSSSTITHGGGFDSSRDCSLGSSTVTCQPLQASLPQWGSVRPLPRGAERPRSRPSKLDRAAQLSLTEVRRGKHLRARSVSYSPTQHLYGCWTRVPIHGGTTPSSVRCTGHPSGSPEARR